MKGYDFEGARRYLLTIHDCPARLIQLYDGLEEYVSDLRNPEQDRKAAAHIRVLCLWQLDKLQRESRLVTFPIPVELRDAAA